MQLVRIRKGASEAAAIEESGSIKPCGISCGAREQNVHFREGAHLVVQPLRPMRLSMPASGQASAVVDPLSHS
eukprot:scaffold276506_cov32-Tisochrysis_lutea.AAC.5